MHRSCRAQLAAVLAEGVLMRVSGRQPLDHLGRHAAAVGSALARSVWWPNLHCLAFDCACTC